MTVRPGRALVQLAMSPDHDRQRDHSYHKDGNDHAEEREEALQELEHRPLRTAASGGSCPCPTGTGGVGGRR
jgi:hypothetical protein